MVDISAHWWKNSSVICKLRHGKAANAPQTIATMRATQILTGTFGGQAFLLQLLLATMLLTDITTGGVLGPLDSFNNFEDTTAPTPTTQTFTHPHWIEPYFDPTTPRNVTALMGKSAYLSCRVRNLGNKTVSWIRHRDIHILTVGSYTYTSDLRFQATHHQESDDWTLQIKWVQKRDAGMYECQISTQPVRSYFVNVNVVVPTATILGGPDLHVDKGSTINLTCTVKFSPEPPAYIFWYHHEEVINYDSTRGGVSVITEKGDVTTSYLLVQNADLADSGKYSCAPSNADVASVRVHVLNGEHPEAMQTGSSGCRYSWLTIYTLMTLVFLYHRQCSAWNANSAPPPRTPAANSSLPAAAKSSLVPAQAAAAAEAVTAAAAQSPAAAAKSAIHSRQCNTNCKESPALPPSKTTELRDAATRRAGLSNQRTSCRRCSHGRRCQRHQLLIRHPRPQRQLICTS